jgi:DNA polymerase I
VTPQKKIPKVSPHSLKGVAGRELDIELDKEHQSSDWGGELSSAMLEYAAKDAQVLPPIAEALMAKVLDAGLEKVSEIEHRALLAMVWMENAGVPFDVEGWKEHLEKVNGEVSRLEEKLADLAPDRLGKERWNWRSPQQVKEAFALVGINLPNTQQETLSRYDHPLAKLLLEHRKASKLVSHFGPKLVGYAGEDGRIHPDWRQIGTETGRMSCSKPNVQQLPPVVRSYVRAPEGRALVWADYAQAEIRVLAAASGDPTLVEAFRAGRDPYKATAANVFDISEEEVTDEQRGVAKVLIFSFIFGASDSGIARNLRTTLNEARRLKERYFATHPRVKAFLERTVRGVRDTGEARTLTGRIRRFGNIHAIDRKEAKETVRKAMNFPMQGSCADGLKLALALLYERRRLCPGAVPIIALHDEIGVECDEDSVEATAKWLEQAMVDGLAEVLALQASGDYRVPVEVEIKTGKTWDDALPWSPPASVHAGEEERITDLYFEDESVSIKVYVDYRDLSVDSLPQIDACDECAEEYSDRLTEADDLRPGEAARCEICGAENAAAMGLPEQEGSVGHL